MKDTFPPSSFRPHPYHFVPISRSSLSHLVFSLSYCAVARPLSGYHFLKPTSLSGLPYSSSSKIFSASGPRRKSANWSDEWGWEGWETTATPPALVGVTSIETQSIGAPLALASKAWSGKIVGDIATPPETIRSAIARPEIAWSATS